MSYKDLQAKAYQVEEDLKVLAVHIDATKTEAISIRAEVSHFAGHLEDNEEDLRTCKSRDIVVMQDFIFLVDCVESIKLKLRDLKVQLAKTNCKLEQLEAKKPELQSLYQKTIKQMEKYDNNVFQLHKATNGRNQKDGTGTA
jgi:chromosome segregation ATPase